MLKRGSRVRTNRGLWSVVAGQMQEDPFTTALVEIEEETGLSRNDVVLVRRGIPIRVSLSPESVTTVHPFLFHTEKMEVRLDWEHEEYRWLTLEELRGLPLVPRFLEMLQSLGLGVVQ